MWVQIHDLSQDMLNIVNANQIANSIGPCLDLEEEKEMHKRGYIHFKTEVAISERLPAGFWWVNGRGYERWAHIKYERLSDFYYGCGLLGHTSLVCQSEIVCSEVNGRLPMYGPWLTCARQRRQSGWTTIGGGSKIAPPRRDPNRKTWKDMMWEGSMRSGSHAPQSSNLKVEVVEELPLLAIAPPVTSREEALNSSDPIWDEGQPQEHVGA